MNLFSIKSNLVVVNDKAFNKLKKALMLTFTVLVISLLLSGCCSLQTRSVNIPFISPVDGHCASIAFQEVLKYYSVAEPLGVSDIKSIPELLIALRKANLHPEMMQPSARALYDAFVERVPVILVLRASPDKKRLHCVVPTAIEPIWFRIRVHDKKPNKILSLRKLKRAGECLIKVYREPLQKNGIE